MRSDHRDGSSGADVDPPTRYSYAVEGKIYCITGAKTSISTASPDRVNSEDDYTPPNTRWCHAGLNLWLSDCVDDRYLVP